MCSEKREREREDCQSLSFSKAVIERDEEWTSLRPISFFVIDQPYTQMMLSILYVFDIGCHFLTIILHINPKIAYNIN